jgi:hypothetical protein
MKFCVIPKSPRFHQRGEGSRARERVTAEEPPASDRVGATPQWSQCYDPTHLRYHSLQDGEEVQFRYHLPLLRRVDED